MEKGLVVKILGDDAHLQKTLSGIGSAAKKGLGIAVKATGAIGAGFVTAAGAALKFSGELEQNLGGAEAVFGEFSDTIEKKAEKAFKNMGLSTADYLATANKMGSLFKGAGFEVKESVDITTEAMQRAADVASIMGIDTAWAMESIAGAAKGNFTMMDNLGVAMNDTTLNAYALEKGLGKTTAQMTNQEKIGLAMEMFLDRTAYAAGNYARENETLAGSLSTAKAALQNFISGSGSISDLQESLKNASTVIVKNLKVLAPQLAEGVVEVVKGLAPVIPDIIIELLPGILDTVQVLFEEALKMVPELITQIADAIGEAVPELKPLAALLTFLADNVDILTAALKTGTAAFVTYKTAALAVNAIVALKTMYGMLTGAIVTAEAAQKSLNASVLANPYVLAAAAVVGLVVAIASLAKAEKSAAAESIEASEKLRDAYDEKIATIEESEQAQQEEAVKVDFLKNRLYDLESQIKSGTLTEAEAKMVQDNFNRSAQDLNDIIPGIIDNLYDETGAISVQKGKVDQLATSYIQLAKAKAKAKALENLMTAAYETLYIAEEEHGKAYSDYKTALDTQEAFNNGEAYDPDKLVQGYELQEKKTASEDWHRTKLKAEEDIDRWADELEEAENEITALSSNTADKIEDNINRVTGTAVSNTQTQKKEVEEAYKKELAALQYKHDIGAISDAEYYAQLAAQRDKYFAAGSDEWDEYTEDITKYYASAMDEISEKQKKQLEGLKEERDDFAESMQSHGSLFEETKNPFFDDSGNVAFYTEDVKLADFSEQTEQIKHFGDNLQALKGKGNIPKELFAEIKEMSREDGIKLTDELLSLSDEDLQKWIDSYSNMMAESNRVSDALFEDEFSGLREQFEQEWEDVPEGFFTVGLDSANEFSAGFINTLKAKMESIKAEILSGFDGLTGGIQISGNQQATAGGNTYNTYVDLTNNPEETTRQQLNAVDDWNTQQQMRGDY